jgi:CCR4-NOT transcription complex subunit 1
VLLGSIKDETDPKLKQLRKLIDDHGMEVYPRFFTRLVAGCASQIFPGHNRQVANPQNYQLLKAEIQKIAHDVDQAHKVAEALDSGTEDVFRDFDLSTFMEHFKMDALEKTILSLQIKAGTRSDLKTKGWWRTQAEMEIMVRLPQ